MARDRSAWSALRCWHRTGLLPATAAAAFLAVLAAGPRSAAAAAAEGTAVDASLGVHTRVDPLDVAALQWSASASGALRARGHPNPLLDPNVFWSSMVLAADGCVLFGTAPFGGAAVSVVVVDNATGAKAAEATATANATGFWLAHISVAATAAPHNVTVTATPKPLAAAGTGAGSLGPPPPPPTALMITDVLFGSVFLCSGQSNMDFCLGGEGHCPGGAFAANTSVANAHLYPEIRLSKGTWSHSYDPNDPDQSNLRHFSAVCYLTAVEIKKQLPAKYGKRPMGLIARAVGGTVIEMWSPPEVMQSCGLPNVSVGSPATCSKQFNSNLYEQQIRPLLPTNISAAFWYQGESNAACDGNGSKTEGYYACLLPGMIESWREAFQQPLPFFVVQLAAYGGTDATSQDRSADPVVRLRSDQLSALSLPSTGVAVAVDLGDDGRVPWTPPTARHGGIHPRNKTEVGRRLALSFAAVAEGVDIVASGPVPTKSGAAGVATVRVQFDSATSAGMALTPTQQCATHASKPSLNSSAQCCTAAAGGAGFPFEVEYSNGTFAVVAASVVPGASPPAVELDAPDADRVARVRYCAQSFPLCVLSNSGGLPSTPFSINVTSLSAKGVA